MNPLVFVILGLGAVFGAQADDHAAKTQQLQHQLALHPDDLDARFQLARTLSWQKRFDEALVEYSRLLKTSPDNSDFLLGIAQTHLWRGAPEVSLPFLGEARRLTPNYEDVWRMQIQALMSLGDPDRLNEARLIRDEARSRFPRSDWHFAALDAPQETSVTKPAPLGAIEESVALPKIARDESSKFQIEAGLWNESLTRGLPQWRSQYLSAEWRWPDRKAFYGGVRETERYDLKDREMHLGGILPFGTDTQAQFEAGVSDTHRVLARRYFLLQIQHRPAEGWSVATGARRSTYDSGHASVLHLSAERYVGNERFSYTLYEGGPDGAGLTPSHRLQWAHHYGERDWFALALTRGRETEYTGNAAFLTSRISGASLSGQHEVAPDWSVSWGLERHRQGDAYTRSGVRLGLRHAF